MRPPLLWAPVASHGIPLSIRELAMNEDWQFTLVITLALVLGTALPFALGTV